MGGKKALCKCGGIDVEIRRQICSLDNCLVSALKETKALKQSVLIRESSDGKKSILQRTKFSFM